MPVVDEIFSGLASRFTGVFDNLLYYIVFAVVIALIGIVAFLFFRARANRKTGDIREIVWWNEINDNLVPIRTDKAKEITIPGSSLKVLYIKEKDQWLPAFTRQIRQGLYYVAFTPNREIINFTLGKLNKEGESELKFDHTDMRWSSENMREYIKRNYRDKAIKWWQAYQGVISTAIFILVMTFSFVLIIYFMRGLMSDMGNISGALAGAVEKINVCNPGSGVVITNGGGS